MYKYFIKPIFDILFAIILIFALLPIFFILIIVLCIINKGKPFFRQKRVGKGNKIFTIFKFKTMNDKRGQDGQLLPDNQRLTFIGKIIRETSIDEIPQLFNILKGEMSFIGPRPLLVRYLPFYTNKEKRRHNVKPGISGYAQIKGRNTLNWNERLSLDVYYVDNISMYLDLKIAYYTLLKVIKREDVALVPNNLMEDLDVERAEK
ncbi:MAG: sugar transferase [Bacteroidetes bacterium]|nr:MAG: sugar transferase [Bacteroidota bacterium]